jgi:hypothetical protein
MRGARRGAQNRSFTYAESGRLVVVRALAELPTILIRGDRDVAKGIARPASDAVRKESSKVALRAQAPYLDRTSSYISDVIRAAPRISCA